MASVPAADRPALLAFQQKTARLQRAVAGASELVGEAKSEVAAIKKALLSTPKATGDLADRASAIEVTLRDLAVKLDGDRVLASHNEPTPPSIGGRVGGIVETQWTTSSAPTQTSLDAYRIAGEEFTEVLAKLKQTVEHDLADLRAKAESAGAPWTPGRVPVWTME